MGLGDAATFASIFAGPGASRLQWEHATRCGCYTDDSAQPTWGCPTCSGYGAVFAAPVEIRALFGSRSAWRVPHVAGQFTHGEARLTTPVAVEPGYVDDRVRDRFRVIDAPGDVAPGRVFYPVAKAVPFLLGSVQRAWRVQLTSLDQEQRLVPQP